MEFFADLRKKIGNVFEAIFTTFGNKKIDKLEIVNASKNYISKNPDWVDLAIKSDPALRELDDVNKARATALEELAEYPGLHAVALHQKVHELYENKEFTNARKLSQQIRKLTGIEIHPGAKLGKNTFIDHGAGIVIGETTEVGNNAVIYHGVTLGGNGKIDGTRRHPIIGNNAVINVGATLFGPLTIGDDAVIDARADMKGDIQIGNKARIGANSEIRGNAKLGNNVKLGAAAAILGNAIIEDDVVIGDGARIIGDIKISKGAKISPGITVKENITAGENVASDQVNSPYIENSSENRSLTSTKPGAEVNYVQVTKNHNQIFKESSPAVSA